MRVELLFRFELWGINYARTSKNKNGVQFPELHFLYLDY
jgi:hypothetical protein